MSTFQVIESEFKHFVLSDADTSMALGATSHLGELGDASLEYMQRSTEEAKQLLARIENMEDIEDFDQQLDLDLMGRYLKQEIFFSDLQQHGQPQRCRKPHGVDGISEGIFQLFVNDERDAEARLGNILTRLQQAPAYLAVEARVITQPIERWRDIELEQGEGLPDLFESILNWAKETDYSQVETLQTAVTQCNEALATYLDDLKCRDCITDFSIGEDKVKELLNLRQINQSPTELAQMAKEFMGETQLLLSNLRVRLCKKYNLAYEISESELHDFLNENFAAKLKGGELSSVLDYYTDQIESINQFVKKIIIILIEGMGKRPDE